MMKTVPTKTASIKKNSSACFGWLFSHTAMVKREVSLSSCFRAHTSPLKCNIISMDKILDNGQDTPTMVYLVLWINIMNVHLWSCFQGVFRLHRLLFLRPPEHTAQADNSGQSRWWSYGKCQIPGYLPGHKVIPWQWLSATFLFRYSGYLTFLQWAGIYVQRQTTFLPCLHRLLAHSPCHPQI